MADHIFRPDRRALLAGLGAAALNPAAAAPAAAQGRPALMLQAKADVLALRPGEPDTPIWSLGGPDLRFRRGDSPEIAFGNDLPAPMVVNWRGLDGVLVAEPLLARASLAPGARDTFPLPLRHAGTFLCDLALLGDGAARPTRALPLIVAESEAIAVDRDEVLLIEDWRLRPDGTAIAPGIDPKDTIAVYTVNGRTTQDFQIRPRERLRLRFVNGFQRHVIAIKMEGIEVRVMALDGQPAEPFLARGGALILAPGTRVDAFIDAPAREPGAASLVLLHDGKEARPIARLIASNAPPIRDAVLPAAPPLPSNGLPARLDLKNALRFDLTLGGPQPDWVVPTQFAATARPAFRAKAGRTVVLALANRADSASIFHLHGHHFRLLDRLDDGWKPFWLDTLAIDPGQTQRIAFAVEHAGRWLVESVATDWAAPRLVRWYDVE
ncbi:MAG: copper oxidase [Bradyrhizobium sp.]|nr:multicopper oxidase domain-containing protein [Bradyrhizobium sp.]THD53403.1 MAG: copper oxidase [Bradyrhizobium sp.]